MRGNYCAACRRAGHFCPGAVRMTRGDGAGEYWLCLECADGLPCAAVRCCGQVRAESSAAVTHAEVAGLKALEDVAPIVPPVTHRTPEELGLSRTVAHAEARPIVRAPYYSAAAAHKPAALYAGRAVPDALVAARKSVVKVKEEVKTVTVKSGRKGGSKSRIPDEIRREIQAADRDVSHSELARKYGISDVSVYKIRREAREGIAGSSAAAGPAPPRAERPAELTRGIVARAPAEEKTDLFWIIMGDLDDTRAQLLFARFSLAEKTTAIRAVLGAKLESTFGAKG